MIKVYQKKDPTFMALAKRHAADLTAYQHVADVDGSDLERAYMLTNTIDGPWWKNAGVDFHGSPDYGMDGCRSTSVGDLLQRDGKFHEVQSCGFAEIEVMIP